MCARVCVDMKKVRFDDRVSVRTMHVWPYASWAARHGPWMQMARDRERFKMRIHRVSEVIEPVIIEKMKNIVIDK